MRIEQEQSIEMNIDQLRRSTLITFSCLIALVVMGLGIAEKALSQSNYGYMLIRVNLSSRERVDVLAIMNVETKEDVRVESATFHPAGVNSWMALVPLPEGRYFLSEFVPRYGIGTAENRTLPTIQKRTDPGSESNTFEIVSGVVNYVGDWTMRINASQNNRFESTVEFDKMTLERYLTEYPEQSSQFEIYLSPMGGNAVSINELAE